jgi:hypothetical protein
MFEKSQHLPDLAGPLATFFHDIQFKAGVIMKYAEGKVKRSGDRQQFPPGIHSGSGGRPGTGL